MASAPQAVIIGGPNGAGKTTLSRLVLPEGILFVNADEIAKTLPAEAAVNNDREAGRQLLRLLDDLIAQRRSFAVETTLASRSLAPKVAVWKAAGFTVELIYVYLPSADISVERVAARVRHGGHNVPEATIRRRYLRGVRNFVRMYRPISDHWQVHVNLGITPELIAEGNGDETPTVYKPGLWDEIISKAQGNEDEHDS